MTNVRTRVSGEVGGGSIIHPHRPKSTFLEAELLELAIVTIQILIFKA